jgi:hypothetical protein
MIGRASLGRPPAHLPLRGAPVARRGDPRPRHCGAQPRAPPRAAGARPGRPRRAPVGADAGVGPRRARRRRDVELQLGGVLGPVPGGDRPHPGGTPALRASAGMGRGVAVSRQTWPRP